MESGIKIVKIIVNIFGYYTLGTNFLKGDYISTTKAIMALCSDRSERELDSNTILKMTGRQRITTKLLDKLVGEDVALYEKKLQ